MSSSLKFMKSKIKVKVSFFHGDADMSRYFSKEFFQEYQFEVNNPSCIECDFWIVYGGLPDKKEVAFVNTSNIFLFTAEFEGGYSQKFLQQFHKVITVDTKLQGNNIVYSQLGMPWFINENFDKMYHQQNITKTKLISIVASNYSDINYTRNYKIRYDFVMALKKYFGNEIDIFGRGFNEIKYKEDGLLPYKFSVAIENMPLPFWVTEKLYDCYLTHTFPLYYDCPNIDRFFNKEAYAKLDIMDHDYSIKMIEKIINTKNYYEDYLDALIEAKKKYLLEYSFQGVIIKAIEQYGNVKAEKKRIYIKPDNKLRSKIKLKLIDLVYKTFK